MSDTPEKKDAERAEAAAEEAVETAAAAETAADESPTPETVEAAVEAEEAADAAVEAAVEGDAEEAEAAAEQAEEAKAEATKPKKPRARKAKAEETAETADEAPAKPKRSRAKKTDTPVAEETTPARKRDQPREVPVGVEVRAQAKYVRTSARKARLVCDHIRGKDVAEARAILAFTPRSVAKDWAKLLESAVANAEHNHELVGEELKIAAVYADEGPTLKRYRPRAMGRATRIRKRTSHLTITLTPKEL